MGMKVAGMLRGWGPGSAGMGLKLQMRSENGDTFLSPCNSLSGIDYATE